MYINPCLWCKPYQDNTANVRHFPENSYTTTYTLITYTWIMESSIEKQIISNSNLFICSPSYEKLIRKIKVGLLHLDTDAPKKLKLLL